MQRDSKDLTWGFSKLFWHKMDEFGINQEL